MLITGGYECCCNSVTNYLITGNPISIADAIGSQRIWLLFFWAALVSSPRIKDNVDVYSFIWKILLSSSRLKMTLYQPRKSTEGTAIADGCWPMQMLSWEGMNSFHWLRQLTHFADTATRKDCSPRETLEFKPRLCLHSSGPWSCQLTIQICQLLIFCAADNLFAIVALKQNLLSLLLPANPKK